MIAPTAIIRGAGMSFGIPVIDVEGTTGYYNSNLNNKMTKALELFENKQKDLPEYDFGFVHIKAVDDAGHDKNMDIKIEQFEKIDAAIALLLKGIEELN
jgi:2,3-bisphosphoglycerate-independent phosphoglycerate mutase